MDGPRQLSLFAGPITAEAPVAPPRPAAAPLAPDGRRELHQQLCRLVGERLRSLVLTDNSSRIFSTRPVPGGRCFDLRIHRSFTHAPPDILAAVAVLLGERVTKKKREPALAKVRTYFDRHAGEQMPRRTVLRPKGRCFDLGEIYDQLNQAYFAAGLEISITWGQAPPPRRRRRHGGFSIRLGSYNERTRLIRIHPALDRPKVPRYVVESVVFHEMLHAVMPSTLVNGRRSIHPPEFRRRERLFEHFTAARRWIDAHLTELTAPVPRSWTHPFHRL